MPVRVLIVDDHPGFRSAAREMLVLKGFCVVAEAENRAGALEAAARLRPDAVLLDVRLGGDSGFDVSRALGRACPGTAVVLDSETDYSECHDLLRLARARGFVAKSRLPRADLTAFWPVGPVEAG